jgi:hypothetical protein
MFVKTKFFNTILIAGVFVIAASYSIAQETTKEKLENIKEDVDKITITAGGEEITFEGDDAKILFKKMKASSHGVHSFYIKENGDSSGTKKIIIKSDGDAEVYEVSEEHGDHMVWFSDEDELKNMEKKVKVEIENGQKKVTITTTENGEEKTEVYEGAEADEYLEKMKSEHGNEILIEVDEDGSTKKIKKIIIEKEKKE